MNRWLKKLSGLLLTLALILALTACGASGGNAANADEGGAAETAEAGDTTDETAAETAETAETPTETAEENSEVPQTKALQLGDSTLSVLIPDSYQEGEMTEEDIADDQVGYYKSDETLMDFDVYYFSKEGYPDVLADFVAQEAAEYNASEIVTDAEINGIPAGYYRSVEESDGSEYNVITYAIEDGDAYVEIAFWLDGDNAEAEVSAIINTLSRS